MALNERSHFKYLRWIAKLIKTDHSRDHFNTFRRLGAYYANNSSARLLAAKAEAIQRSLADRLINVRILQSRFTYYFEVHRVAALS